ncbi:hypothetical protein TREMEDRAFT_59057 [Tremella mesenterica DSM 1558]|uniref:uncharacterized protein n=1 Tax=Tremella mesenterica (strain ATCC 24925 / CBS 8224 / DSM 1558 / NBRC 9311 / NRRL Y-6157 / RJB 2259-6 / UBC 559-6) TaxID=578456 RepID=UPI0003F48DAB|nr:uncharacterized protein TREMEDRAFT_59057 [Tremella mesenterica DSM 1558]EIW72895.1 hypothetical protein TREMEDRAFT_59057 [Tremella mesenterica DSM 1558]
MPRKAPPKEAVAPIDQLTPPSPPSPIVHKLRQDWRWAGISQFLWTFSDAFGLLDWDIEILEADFDGSETVLIPDLIAKLLYALTYNRQINRENAFEHLRKQYLKRVPETNVLGTLEEPVEWATLGLSQKVQIFWELCEWQMADPARFRGLLKSEDDAVTWRIDPIGWDKSGNIYYLFDDNRLWVQRLPPPPPRPPKKTSLKAMRALKRQRPPPPKKKEKKPAPPSPSPSLTPPPPEPEDLSGPRKRRPVSFYGNLTPTVDALKRGGPSTGTPHARGSRSSTRLNGHVSEPSASPSKRGGDTRVLRNGGHKEEGSQGSKTASKGKRKALGDDEKHQALFKAKGLTPFTKESSPSGAEERSRQDSELTTLSDEETKELSPTLAANGASTPARDEDVDMGQSSSEAKERDEKKEQEISDVEEKDGLGIDEENEEDEVRSVAEAASNLPEGFVEWEAVCVTLYDWRTWPEQFSQSRHPDEKALYHLLKNEVGPKIIEELIVKEQERLKQEAINNRKRSSRIATRELEREEQLRREAAQREMEERMERVRMEELRAAKEEAEAIARERAREERLREREERALAREEAALAKVIAEQKAKERAEREREERLRRREGGSEFDGDRKGNGTTTPVTSAGVVKGQGERWELNCEICRKTGWNLDDETDVVCCDTCNRWQHVECHDRQDKAEGRPPRNWAQVDFKCKDCRRRAARERERQLVSAPLPPSSTAQPRPVPTSSISPVHPPPTSSTQIRLIVGSGDPSRQSNIINGPPPTSSNQHINQPQPPQHPLGRPIQSQGHTNGSNKNIPHGHSHPSGSRLEMSNGLPPITGYVPQQPSHSHRPPPPPPPPVPPYGHSHPQYQPAPIYPPNGTPYVPPQGRPSPQVPRPLSTSHHPTSHFPQATRPPQSFQPSQLPFPGHPNMVPISPPHPPNVPTASTGYPPRPFDQGTTRQEMSPVSQHLGIPHSPHRAMGIQGILNGPPPPISGQRPHGSSSPHSSLSGNDLSRSSPNSGQSYPSSMSYVQNKPTFPQYPSDHQNPSYPSYPSTRPIQTSDTLQSSQPSHDLGSNVGQGPSGLSGSGSEQRSS